MNAGIAVLIVVIVLLAAVGAYYVATGYGKSNNTYTSTVQSSGNSGQNGSQYSVRIMSSASAGNYLANGSGFTLYYYKRDTQGSGTSACTGGCTSAWHPFYTSPLTLQPGLGASNFSTITRSDGTKQLAYDGWPLYHFTGDTAPGELNGEGYSGVWYAVQAP
ncbi:MAG: hypothetical protein KGI06_01115 [Candidatus Micrarchaeota archaeon]|nr:hypothetical protein [Candidatus Micrarchaeota archaeon]